MWYIDSNKTVQPLNKGVNMATKWTVTSPNGQVLHGELEDGNVLMSSAKGNHGQVTLAVWQTKLAEMSKLGYKIEKA